MAFSSTRTTASACRRLIVLVLALAATFVLIGAERADALPIWQVQSLPSASVLNMRTGPDVAYPVITTIPHGAAVHGTWDTGWGNAAIWGNPGLWRYVYYNGSWGWSFDESSLGYDSLLGPIGSWDVPSTSIGLAGGTGGLNGWYTVAPAVVMSRSHGSSTQYNHDGGGWIGYGGAFTAVQGAHTVYGRSWYLLWGPTASLAYKVDSGAPPAPSLSSTSHAVGTWVRSRSVALSWSALSDAISGPAGCSYILTTSPAATPDTVLDGSAASRGAQWSAPADGRWYLAFRTRDNAGNWSSVARLGPICIDTVVPTTTSDAAASYDTTAQITLTPADDPSGSGVAGTFWRIDGGAWTSGTVATTTSVGPHTIEFYSRDIAGGNGPVGSADFSVRDVTPPTTTCNAAASYDTTAQITLTPTDDPTGSGVAGTFWRIDGGAWTSGTVAATTVVGAHTIEYYSGDAAGNDGPVMSADFIVRDVTPPTTTSDAVATYDTQATITLTPADDPTGSGIAGTFWRFNGNGVWTSGTVAVMSVAGAHDFQFFSVDAAGNGEPSTLVRIVVRDVTPPATTLSLSPALPDGGGGWYVTSPTATLSADETAAVVFSLDGAPDSPYTDPFTIGEGAHELRYSALDIHGNAEESATARILVDLTPPAISHDCSGTYTGAALVNIVVADALSGVADLTVLLDGVAHAGPNVVSDAPGPHSITVSARDIAGNTMATATISFTVLPAETDHEVIGGSDRYDTACEISREAFPDSADAAILVSGANWPDALGAAALGGAIDAPVLLTPGGALHDEVALELARLRVQRVVIIGGQAAVGGAVEAKVGELGFEVERISGDTRFATAANVSARVRAERAARGKANDGTVFMSSGVDFPDALAASALAAAKGWPLLLTEPNGVPDETREALSTGSVRRVVVLGGDKAVGKRVIDELSALGVASTRLGGKDRDETAVRVASFGVDDAGMTWNGVGIACDEAFPDALTGGVLQARRNSVILLTGKSGLPECVTGILTAKRDLIDEVHYLGGDEAVPSEVRAEVISILR